MKYFSLICFSFLATAAFANDNTISSLHATYEENVLVLEGEVHVEHTLGNLFAEKASLKKQEENKEAPFASIHLEEKVKILCKNQTTLECDAASLDFTSSLGRIWSKGPSLVSYIDPLMNGSETFQIQSKAIELTLDQQDSSFGEYPFKEVKAKEKVLIQYGKDFMLQTDEAQYEKTSSSLNGILKAYPQAPNLYSQLLYQEEVIETSFIEIWMEKHQIFLKDPKGSLPSSLFSSKQQGQLFFSCKDLSWDHLKGIVTLQKDIQVQESHFGSLLADDTLTIKQNNEKEDNFIQFIDVKGKSVLSHRDVWLTSFGSLHIDGIKGQALAESPKKDGKTPLGEQLIFQNNEIRLYANKASLEYSEPLHELSSATFYGNIRIQSLESAKTARYALADKVTYAIDTKTVILSANAGKKVLFWDEEQGATLSAKEVHLTQNPITHKTEIKGIGNLKLSLSKEEQKLLKNYFPSFPSLEETEK